MSYPHSGVEASGSGIQYHPELLKECGGGLATQDHISKTKTTNPHISKENKVNSVQVTVWLVTSVSNALWVTVTLVLGLVLSAVGGELCRFP